MQIAWNEAALDVLVSTIFCLLMKATNTFDSLNNLIYLCAVEIFHSKSEEKRSSMTNQQPTGLKIVFHKFTKN